MLPITIIKTIENLPQVGFFAYITYQLHKTLAHWQLIIGFGGITGYHRIFSNPPSQK